MTPSHPDLIQQWAAKHAPVQTKAVPDLTNEEQLALYILAGGEIMEGDGQIRSRRRCGIYKKRDGTFHVIMEGDGVPGGTVVKFKVKNSTP